MRPALLAVLLTLVGGSAAADVTLTPVQVIQLAQSALVVLEEDPGPVDGRLGPRTRAAIDAYVWASGLEMGWDPRSREPGAALDQGQAMSLNVAATPALARAFGHPLDGVFGYIDAFPMDRTDALLAGELDGVGGGVDCDAAPDRVVQLSGLIVFEPDRGPSIVTAAPPELLPLPATGAWHAEAEPWRLLVVGPDVLSFQQEGDHYVYGRCRS